MWAALGFSSNAPRVEPHALSFDMSGGVQKVTLHNSSAARQVSHSAKADGSIRKFSCFCGLQAVKVKVTDNNLYGRCLLAAC